MAKKIHDIRSLTAANNIYLSNSRVINKSALGDKDSILIIGAKCGFGKTSYALSNKEDGLLKQINKHLELIHFICQEKEIKPSEMLFLTSRKVIKQQQLKGHTNTKQATIDDFTGFNFLDCDKIRVATAHQFGEWVKQEKVKIVPKVLVIDEIHSLFSESIFAESLNYTIDFILEHFQEMIKIGLSATPEFLYNYVSPNLDIKFRRIDAECGSKYQSKEVICYTNGTADTVLSNIKDKINTDYKVIYYTQSATKCYELSSAFGNKSAFLISDYNKSVTKDGIPLVDIMNAAGVKQFIIDNERFPDDIDIIFINSACREGLNIKDDRIQAIICESVDMITIQQIMGRYRGNLNSFFVIANGYQEKELKRINDDVKDFVQGLRQAATKEEKNVILAYRYGRQQENEKLAKLVYKVGNELKVNVSGISYLEYKYECYLKLRNTPYNVITYSDGRTIEDRKHYLEQLLPFAADGIIKITKLISGLIDNNNNSAIDVFKSIENEWLNRKLTKEDKDKLVSLLNVKRKSGNSAAAGSWTTVKKLLVSSGYTVTQKKSGSMRFDIITK